MIVPKLRGEPPVFLGRYLLPDEHAAISLRQHPALFLPQLTAGVGGLVVAMAVDGLRHGAGYVRFIVWLISLLLIARCFLAVLYWLQTFIVITDRRFILISGILNRRVQTIPLPALKELTFSRALPGRKLGYGSIAISSGGQAYVVVDYLPYPEQVQLQILGTVFKDGQ